MPTVDLPAMRSIRMLSARSARQRSSLRPVTRLYLMPASGLNSKVVTTGPGLICDDRAAHVELAALFAQHLRQVLQLSFVDGAVFVGAMQQRRRRQLVAARQLRHRGLAMSDVASAREVTAMLLRRRLRLGARGGFGGGAGVGSCQPRLRTCGRCRCGPRLSSVLERGAGG